MAARQADPDAEPEQFRFAGELFTISDHVGIIPLGRFAKAASSGLDSAEMEALGAMLDLLGEVVIDEDRTRFFATATRVRATGDDLMPIVSAVIEAQSGRPTQRPSVSPGGSQTTGPSSKAPSSSVARSPLGNVAPIMLDPRVQGLQSVDGAGMSLVG